MKDYVEFPFRHFRLRDLGLQPRPLVQITVRGPAGELPALFVLDSGADVSLIPYSMGKRLGLSLEGTPRYECRGIGKGHTAYHLCPVELQIGHFRISVHVGWSTIEDSPFLLGRLDVFDQLDVEFRQASNRIILRRAASGA